MPDRSINIFRVGRIRLRVEADRIGPRTFFWWTGGLPTDDSKDAHQLPLPIPSGGPECRASNRTGTRSSQVPDRFRNIFPANRIRLRVNVKPDRSKNIFPVVSVELANGANSG